MEINFQNGVAFGMLCIVVVYLTNRFIIKPLRKSKAPSPDQNCGPDCKCS